MHVCVRVCCAGRDSALLTARQTGGLPDFVGDVVKRMNDAAVVEEEEDAATGTKVQRRRWPESDQLTVNEYEEGVGIGAHIDTHSGTTHDTRHNTLTHTLR